MSSKSIIPTFTIKSSSVVFNIHAIRMLDECKHIKIMVRSDKKFMFAMPCEEDAKDAVRWSKADKHGNIKPRTLYGKSFPVLLYRDMKQDINSTVKLKGSLIEEKGEKLIVFSLTNEKVPEHRFLLFTMDMLN
jgi:hypothetical protein